MNLPFDTQAFNGDFYMERSILTMKESFGLDAAVETGTYKGATTAWLARTFDKVYAAEVMEQYFHQTQLLLETENLRHKVSIYLEDCRTALARIMREVSDKTLLVLDANGYADPLPEELEIIRSSGKKPYLVLPGFKNPQHPDYLFGCYEMFGITYNWEYIRPEIEAIYGEQGFRLYHNEAAAGAKRGVIFILPK